ncbi:DNRLRE domain-containing protein [Streptomyces sp. NBC_01618]|uniref:DNRLRE domain-containing protein n=1 Tax=Streptomyces sp. NBC_01618 TaxID=2975900 RepID=UPI0038693A8B|nr:DNRLRE domain-containing protein [Streptomyces sp. NBC_01618]
MRHRPTATGRIALSLAAVLLAETALLSVATGTAFAGPAADADQAVPKKPAPSAAANSADSVATALLMARLQDRRIEVAPERTATSTTYALPSGELQTTTYAGPIRTKVGGTWRNIDTSLLDTGSSLEPAVTVADIKVSDGGDTALASVSKGDKSFEMGWGESLPTPDVKGDTAAYDLGDGQTLTVTALSQGFSQNVVLGKAPSRAPEYRIPLKLDGLKLSQADSGRLLLKDRDGKLVAEAPAPMMWDSSRDDASGESRHQAPVDTEIETAADGSQTLVLSPGADYFERDLTYPVTVDPTSTLAATTDTWVATNYPDSQVSSTELKSGTYDGGTTKARSYLMFDVSKFKGKRITDTNLALYSYYSSTCQTTGAGTQVRRVTSSWSSSSVTWGAQPSTTATGAVTNKAALGYDPACPAGTMNFDIDAIVQAWADGSANYGLRVAGASETDSLTWRRFRSANYVSGDGSTEPHLTVTYNSYPALPSSLSISPSQLNAYNGKRYVTSLTPTLSAKVTDPDGANTRAQFEITADPASADTTYAYTGTSPAVASGSVAKLTVPSASALPAGKHLRYRVRAYDGADYGAWSGYTVFVLNTAKPAAPAVSCDVYEQNGWTPKAAGAVTCTLDTVSTDGAGYHWGLDDAGTPNRKLDTVKGTGGDELTISIAPGDGWHTLYARTVDSGGNLSTTTAYSFGVGSDGAAILSPSDGDETARRLTLAARGLPSYTGVTWQYRRGETDSWRTVPAGAVTASGDAVSAWPVPVTGGAAPQLVWNVVSTLAEDGVIELRAAFTDGTATGQSQTVEVTLDRDAGNAPSAPVGPGSVNQLTGDFTLSATDASALDTTVGRVFSSRTNATDTEGQAEIFGPGWTSSVASQSTSFTQIRATSSTSLEVLNADGSTIAFTSTAGGGWAAQPGHDALKLTGTLSGTKFTLTDTDANTTVFAKATAGSATWSLSSTAAAVADSAVTVASESVVTGGETLARPKYIISPTPAVAASTCQAEPSARGCRVLEFVYADATTAAGSTLGDYKNRVSNVRLWATSPGATQATAETLTSYAYDTSGRLRTVWDPQISPALKTAYTYNADGRIETLTEPGRAPWTFVYGTTGSAATAGAGMLLTASRPALASGSDSQVSGTAVTSLVYDVPLTGAKAPRTMDSASVAAWGQKEAPTDATAVFPPGSVPSSHNGGDLTSDAYDAATITYVNAGGQETNTANPGDSLTATQYDAFGNTLSELTGENRNLALGTANDAADRLATLGLTHLSTAERAQRLSAVSEYSADGNRLLHEYGPLHEVVLTRDLTGSTADSTLTAGTTVPARLHKAYSYDENRPSDAKLADLVTTTRTGAFVEGYTKDGDVRTLTASYDWATGQTKATGGDDTTGLVTEYGADGKVSATRTARSSGSDSGTIRYTYYTAGGTGSCAGRPEWAGLVCRTAPAAAVTGNGGNPAEKPTTVYTYDRWTQLATKTETANGQTRTTTITKDNAGRPVKTAVTGGAGQALPDTTVAYDPANGQVATRTSGGRTIAYAYDTLGRPTSYDDGAGNRTATAYDILDRPVKVTDSVPSTRTSTYDLAGNRKTLTDSVAGTFTASYDADGTLTSQTLPGGSTLTVTTNTSGDETGRVYSDAEGSTILSDNARYTVHGEQIGHTQTDGSTTDTTFGYDAAGRLARATDTTATGCTIRAYTLDAASNRTALKTTTDDCDSTTDDAVVTTTSHSYDSADRLVAPGVAYDEFGRTTSVDDSRLTYFANDLVHSETVGSRRTTWSLDAAGRLALTTDQTRDEAGNWSTTATTTNHYGCDCDSPSWTKASAGSVSRNVSDAGGALGAITTATGGVVLQLANLHGDVAVQLPLDPAAVPTVQRFDEFGNVLDGTVSAAYGWLGAYQRDSGTLSGITLMGVRLYQPTSGRFLQADPVYGGNDNDYEYCRGNPVSCTDLTGAYSYSFSYNLGGYFSSAKTVFKWIRNHFWVFPLSGCGATLNRGERCNLKPVLGPVKVEKLTSTYFQFLSLKGHFEGPGKRLRFTFSKSWGMVYMKAKAWGPNKTKCDNNTYCSTANKIAARTGFALFASNISFYTSLYGVW